MTEKKQLIEITGNTYPVKDQLKTLGARWNAERKCWMVPADKAAQAQKLVSGQAPLNNPIAVPPDRGPIDIAAECAKHGRTPLGTSAVPFRMASGKTEATTAGKTFWGKDRGVRARFLILRDGRPFYLSADTLEDNDDFRSRPGWYRSVEAVAVEPTAEETATDPAALKAAKEAAEKAEKARLEAEKAARIAANEPRLREIAELAARSEETGGTGGCTMLWGSWDGPCLYGYTGFLIYCATGSDRTGCVLRDPALAAEAFRLAEKTVSYID